MALRFTMLASGSRGNACLIQVHGFGVLLDAGLGPRQLADRLREAGHSWASVHAMLLTHTHSDHWNDRTLSWLHRRELPLYCHPNHHNVLRRYSPSFGKMDALGLVRPFAAEQELRLAPGLRCYPLAVRHDSGATFGFRLEGPPDLFGNAPAIGYAADLGTWDDELAGRLSDVDLLALEFNHDVALEHGSRRPAALIARVLGDEGHLSNDQAAALVRTVLGRSPPGRLRHLVQLHLSEDCNRPALARRAAQGVLDELSQETRLHTARQDGPLPPLELAAAAGKRRGRAGATSPAPRRNGDHPRLPGFDEHAGAEEA
jgi:phosphoribosyl 1,2-cyclic phosphodiesterase